MKILMYAHRLDVGGTQTNSIELAATLRDRFGHDVTYFATPGPTADLVRAKRLNWIPAPASRVHPSPARISALRRAVDETKPDLLHVWDWPQCLDAFYGVHLPRRMPMALTVMSMVVPRFLPKALPTTFGTPELVDKARQAGRGPLDLLLPPVDVDYNAPGVADGKAFREQLGIQDGELVLVTVSRLVEWLKGESLYRTIRAVGAVARTIPVRFVIVGDGTARKSLEALAETVNAAVGRPVVRFTGALLDPRPAYAAADVVVGMGGSALRAMAFAKPVIVVGEANFSAPFNSATAEMFYYKGIYGLGDPGGDDGELIRQIRHLTTSHQERLGAGRFARDFVVRHFSLDAVSARLEAFLEQVAARRPRRTVVMVDGFRTAMVLAAGRARLRGPRRWIPARKAGLTAPTPDSPVGAVGARIPVR